MTILQWRLADPSDVGSLQSFSCTSPPKRQKSPPFGKVHPKPWEYDVQCIVRGRLKPRRGPGTYLWVGLHDDDLAAVFQYEREDPSDVFMCVAAVSVEHRGNGGIVADELFTTFYDEVIAQGADAGLSSVQVTAHIHEMNEPSKRMAHRQGMEHVDMRDKYEVWQVVIELPPELLDVAMPSAPIPPMLV